MKDLDIHDRLCEETFGLISGFYVHELHQLSTAAGSKWDYNDRDTMEIVVTKNNADAIYALCRAIRTDGYSVGLRKKDMKKIKEARLEAHAYLVEEANNPATSIERKIELTRLTSTGRKI
jgi:hypothetical protein